jgi:hypothetical protein
LKIDGKKNPQWRDPQESIIKGSYQPNRNGSISWIPACAGMNGIGWRFMRYNSAFCLTVCWFLAAAELWW